MGMGFAAAYCDAVSWRFIEGLCPKEAAALESIRKRYDIGDADFGRIDRLAVDDQSNLPAIGQELVQAWHSLRSAFYEQTIVEGTGLELTVFYHDEDDGDCYDDITGLVYAVEGSSVPSPAGRKFGNHIRRCLFVECC